MKRGRRAVAAGLVPGPLALRPLAARAQPQPLRRLGVLGNAPVLPVPVVEQLLLARGWRRV